MFITELYGLVETIFSAEMVCVHLIDKMSSFRHFVILNSSLVKLQRK